MKISNIPRITVTPNRPSLGTPTGTGDEAPMGQIPEYRPGRGVSDYMLDPTSGPYNDQPTDYSQARQPNVYRDLKQQENEMTIRQNLSNPADEHYVDNDPHAINYKPPEGTPLMLGDAIEHTARSRIDREDLGHPDLKPFLDETTKRVEELYLLYGKDPEVTKMLDEWSQKSGHSTRSDQKIDPQYYGGDIKKRGTMGEYNIQESFGSLWSHVMTDVFKDNLEDEKLDPHMRDYLEWASQFDMYGRPIPDYKKHLERFQKGEAGPQTMNDATPDPVRAGQQYAQADLEKYVPHELIKEILTPATRKEHIAGIEPMSPHEIAAHRLARSVVKGGSPERDLPLANFVVGVASGLKELATFPDKVATGEIDLRTPEGMDKAIKWAVHVAINSIFLSPTKIPIREADRTMRELVESKPWRNMAEGERARPWYSGDVTIIPPETDIANRLGEATREYERARGFTGTGYDTVNITNQYIREVERILGNMPLAPRGWRSVEGRSVSDPDVGVKIINFKNKEGVKGNIIASLEGDTIKVESIGMEGRGVHNYEMLNTLGIKGTRKLLMELQAAFPEAKNISGYRVTGANPEVTKIMSLPGKGGKKFEISPGSHQRPSMFNTDPVR